MAKTTAVSPQLSPEEQQNFRQFLAHWANEHPRPLPWKGIRDPYRIWLSEVILQQTRVAQGLAYYERFVAAYPAVQDLAAAPEDDLMRQWEGLGYYARARNLHQTAKYIAQELNGIFPNTYEGIRALKGVGDYTAAAIASFAFDLPYAVVDGNVYRVLARYFGVETPIDSTAGKQQFAQLAQLLLDAERPAAYNQAMMDFGASWCTPKRAQCQGCLMQNNCRAFAEKKVDVLPMKSKKMLKKERFFIYLVFIHEGKSFLTKRLEKDIWQDLHTFPAVEVGTLQDFEQVEKYLPQGIRKWRVGGLFKQTLTHRVVAGMFVEIELNADELPLLEGDLEGAKSVSWTARQIEVPVPRLMDAYWQDRSTRGTLFF